jgi:hypothetical protein
MPQKSGRGNALRKVLLHTFLLPDKSMTPGGKQPAGSVFQKKQGQQIHNLLP